MCVQILLDRLVGAQKERSRHVEAKGSCSFQIENKLELGRLLDRGISRLGALGNAIYVFGLALKQCDDIRSVG